jgi:predicted MFS family arabinose efflux permease
MVTTDSKNYDPNAISSIAAYLITAAIAPLMVFIGPIVVGAYVDVLGYSEKLAAQIYAADLAGATLGGVLAFALLRRLDWRTIMRVGIVLFLISNLLSLAADTFSALVTIRLLAGTGAGTLTSMTIVSIGLTKSPDRIYGLWGASQFTLAALVAAVLPGLIADYGLAAPFLILSGLGLAIVCVTHLFPHGAEPKSGGSSLAGTRRGTVLGVIGLTGFFIFFLGQAAVWPFGERIGISAGFSTEQVGNAVAISLVGAIFGSLVATVIGNTFGRLLPLVATMVGASIGAIIITSQPSLTVFTVGLFVFSFAWNSCIPFLNGIMANLDRGGRLLAAAGIVIPASSSAGPAIGSLVLVEGNGYAPIIWLLLASLLVGFILLYPAARERNEPL